MLARSISYLHIVSTNFLRCVACQVLLQIPKFELLLIFTRGQYWPLGIVIACDCACVWTFFVRAITHHMFQLESSNLDKKIQQILLKFPIVFSCDQAALYEWYFPSVRLSVTPFSLCSHHRIIMKFSGVITNDKSDVHAKGQGQRSKVKVTEVKT